MAKKEEAKMMLPPWGGVWHMERGMLNSIEGTVLDSSDDAVRVEAVNDEGRKLDVVVMKSTITAYFQVVTEEVKEA